MTGEGEGIQPGRVWELRQGGADLTTLERLSLLKAWPWPEEAATTLHGFADVIAVVEEIIANRTAPHDTPRTDERAGLSERIAAGRLKHGVGASEDFPGNVCHLVSPIVGTLRLRQRDGGPVPDLGHIIDRLSLVLDMARAEAAADRLAAAVARADAVRTTVSDQRESFLPSPGLDPAWIAGWHAAIDHAASTVEKALADVLTSAPTGEAS